MEAEPPLGAAGKTWLVAEELAVPEPPGLLAVTWTLRYWL
jgi:hypothetical protein